MSNILVVGAHFDDAELGAGGTMARLSEEGHTVYKLTLTNNVTRPQNNITEFENRDIATDYESSAADSARACEVLGVKEVHFTPLECCQLFYTTEVMQRIEKLLYELDIDTTFIQYGSDMNQDHVEGSRMSLTALRHCRNILMYQSNGYILERDYYPRFFVDISSTLEKKKRALACYGDAHDRYGRLFEMSTKRSEVWGYNNEVAAAEGFHIVKMLY